MGKEIKIAEISFKLQELIKKTYLLLDKTNNSELKERVEKELVGLQNRIDLKVAFVGQYSSGKSTIISAITGNRSIEIDANVATDSIYEYRWNNIVLLDTPGILAGKTEKHDEKTKEALKQCDLIVYVITSQLFDDVIFENFIELAYNQALKDKMLIAVNKMSMEDGEIDELKANYLFSINNIFKERGYEYALPTVFLDAADYIEGVDDEDQEFILLSNFNTFVSQLNVFVEKKGIIKKQFDTPIRILQSSLSDIALGEVNPGLEIIVNQGLKKVIESRNQLKNNLKIRLSNFEYEIRNDGYSIGNSIGEISDEELRQKIDCFENSMTNKINDFNKEIESLIEDEQSRLFQDINEFSNKGVLISFENSLDLKLKNSEKLSVGEIKNLKRQKEFLGFLKEGGNELAKSAIKDTSLVGLRAVSGSNLHGAVYSTGKFLGHNFKPWGAVKVAGKIGKVASCVGPVVSVYEMYLSYKEDKKEDEYIKKVKIAKDTFFDSIRTYSSDIKESIRKTLDVFIKENYENRIDSLNKEKIEIVKLSTDNKEFSAAIEKLDIEYVEFIDVLENI